MEFKCSRYHDILDIQLSSIKENLIDLIWRDQPPRQFHPIIMLDSSGTGKKIGDALESIRDKMREHQSEVLVISALDEVACKSFVTMIIDRKNLFAI